MFFKNISALVIFSCHKTSEFSKNAAFGWKNTCRFFIKKTRWIVGKIQ